MDNNIILQNTLQIRNPLQTEQRNQYCIERKTGEVKDVPLEQVINSICEHMYRPKIENSVVLCGTNALANEYNDAIDTAISRESST